jgi:hypothetical protein
MNSKPTGKRFPGGTWALAIVPLILLGVVMTYLLVTGGGLKKMTGPPLEQVTIQRVTLPDPGLIFVEVVNDGPQEVTIAQVLVDEAYWEFYAEPSMTIPRLEKILIKIPYPWVAEETHEIKPGCRGIARTIAKTLRAFRSDRILRRHCPDIYRLIVVSFHAAIEHAGNEFYPFAHSRPACLSRNRNMV